MSYPPHRRITKITTQHTLKINFSHFAPNILLKLTSFLYDQPNINYYISISFSAVPTLSAMIYIDTVIIKDYKS